ncbi:MAG: ADP-dependent glucokinase/phosphofructokinase [Candidatus Heimdallarchaeaceae archaeon]
MKNWKKNYLEASKLLDTDSICSKGVILGFNVNIDKVIKITPKILSSKTQITTVEDGLSNNLHLKKITNIEELLICLLQSIKEGKADEVLISSDEVAIWIEENFVISRTVVGGQAGIMANLLKTIQVNPVLLSTPISSSALIKLLDPSIINPIVNCDEIHSEIERTSEKIEPITHYVFEFSAGKYTVANQVINCKRSNRFIGSYDKVNSLLMFSEEFREYSVTHISDYALCVIAGFHLIDLETHPSQSYTEFFKPVLSLIREWKARNPLLRVHLELAAVKDGNLKQAIIDHLFSVVDSIGLNEQELMSFLHCIDKSFATYIHSTISSINIFKGMHAIFSKYPHIRLHLHYLDYFLLLSPLISEESAYIRKNSLIISSLFAAVKAKNGFINKQTDTKLIDYNISKRGLEELQNLENYLKTIWNGDGNLINDGYIQTKTYTVVGVPTIVVPFPKQLVGLGDTISLMSLLYEFIKFE